MLCIILADFFYVFILYIYSDIANNTFCLTCFLENSAIFHRKPQENGIIGLSIAKFRISPTKIALRFFCDAK